MMTHIPQGGSQDYLEVPFSTHEFEQILSGDMKEFLQWLDRVQARKDDLSAAQSGQAMRYRLGQFTTNRSRIGILHKGVIPGIRRIATDYASNAYQTVITEPTLRIFQEEAERMKAPVALAAAEPDYEDADITERTWASGGYIEEKTTPMIGEAGTETVFTKEKLQQVIAGDAKIEPKFKPHRTVANRKTTKGDK